MFCKQSHKKYYLDLIESLISVLGSGVQIYMLEYYMVKILDCLIS